MELRRQSGRALCHAPAPAPRADFTLHRGAAQRIVHWLREFGARGVKVAAVGGSLITGRVLELTDRIMENGEPTSTLAENLISAEVYLGAEPIAEALKAGARTNSAHHCPIS